jgi:hypothetical protein
MGEGIFHKSGLWPAPAPNNNVKVYSFFMSFSLRTLLLILALYHGTRRLILAFIHQRMPHHSHGGALLHARGFPY